MKKVLLFCGLGLIGLVIAVVIGVGLFIGPVIKAGVETLGPKITQVSVKLDAVDVSLLSGGAAIKGLVVGNPQGYSSPEAIKLGRAEIKLDLMSVLSEKVVIRAIRVESPEITYDGKLKGSNISKILDNVNAVAQKGGSAPDQAAGAEKDKGPSKPAPKIQVDEFLISGAKIRVNLTGLTSKEMTVTLPDIHLKDLGKGTDGITPTELVRVVLSQINLSTVKAVTEAVAGSGKMIEDLGKDMVNNPQEKIKAVTKGLGGLFGK